MSSKILHIPRGIVGFLAGLLLSLPCRADTDKSVYTLFNPTPQSDLRPFNPNRPSVTEGPITVDAGHYQFEFSFAEYTYDYDHGLRSDQWAVLPGNVRVGVLNDLELDLIIQPYLDQWTHGRGTSVHLRGAGDTILRAAWNLWGNDGGATAGALLPFVRFPTASDGLSDHHIEGGLIVPVAASLPAGFALGAMMEFDIDRNSSNSGYGLDLLHTITVSHALTQDLSAFIEYAGIAPINTGHTYLAYFDAGLTYMLAANVELDTAVNVGLSGRANDLTVVAGLSFRI